MNQIKILLFLLITFSVSQAQTERAWKIINQNQEAIVAKNPEFVNTSDQLLYHLDLNSIQQSLVSLNNKTAKNYSLEVSIPNKNGVLEKYTVWEYSNFSPELQALYPQIRAYAGVGITDKTATINFSVSPQGFQTMVLRANTGSEFIEPYSVDNTVYVLFDSKTRKPGELPYVCSTDGFNWNKLIPNNAGKTAAVNSGNFRTLRLALSCTGEYTVHFGGTVALALAAMNATMTRVNGVFNKDLSVKLEMINAPNIIYTDAATDPYSNATAGVNTIAGCTSTNSECPQTWSNELQTTLTGVVGEANYDIGHLFGATGGGGNAGCIGCICDPLTPLNTTPVYQYGKGSAYTSPPGTNPSGDTFDIDFVAHEMGHQLGAYHTFSYAIEGTGASVEPGSGTTIMAYAGVSNGFDVQKNSDDYFAYKSISEIKSTLLTKTCPAITTIANNAPTINAGLDYTIPKGTAFILKGTGTNNPVNTSYCWEQNDSAVTTSGSLSFAIPTKIDGPLFRSFPPTSSLVRFMPAFTSVVNGNLTTSWESVSSVARTLNFVLTARDNAALGSAQTTTDQMVVTVSDTAGPFAISSQNSDDIIWAKGSAQTITWSVNNTNNLTGSSNVNIKLSTDGGLTFPTFLATNIPNNGSAIITVPAISSLQCRILIEPTANIFYAINSKNFAIGYSIGYSCTTYPIVNSAVPIIKSNTAKSFNIPTTMAIITSVSLALDFTHSSLVDVQINIQNPAGTIVKLYENSCGNNSGSLLLNYTDSGTAISCATTTLQNTTPFQPLAIYNNQNPQGNWILNFKGTYAANTGTLNSANMTICTKTYTLDASYLKIDDLVLYPNPNQGNFNIKFSSLSPSGVTVLVNDLLGRKIFEKQFNKATNFNENIQLNNTQPGLYLLTVMDGDRKVVKKIVIK